MDTDKIKNIISLFENSNVPMMDLEVDDMKIKMCKDVNSSDKSAVEHVEPQSTNISKPIEAEVKQQEVRNAVKSPLVGTFYASRKQGGEPLVKVGDKVNKGDVVCIIEAMKVMNEIKANVSGIVTEILVDDGAMVQFDQDLIALGD